MAYILICAKLPLINPEINELIRKHIGMINFLGLLKIDAHSKNSFQFQ